MRYYKINPQLYNDIIEAYTIKKENTYQIAKKYNVSNVTINRILRKKGITVGIFQTNKNKIIDRYSNNIQKEICEKYSNGDSIKNLSKFYKTKNEKHIYKILKYNKIKIRSNNTECKKYKIRETYFDDINDEYKSYFLGLLFADGCNTGKNIIISLMENDECLLKELSNKIFINKRPLYFLPRAKEKITYKNQYKLVISDPHIKMILEKYGIVRRKSLICGIPNVILNKELFRHFLRGYFDGDGGVYLVDGKKKLKNKTIKKYKNLIRMTITGTETFLSFLTKEIQTHIGLDIISKIYTSSLTKEIKDIKIGKKEDIKILFNFMYKDANIFSPRKYKIFKKIYGEINENEN